MIFKRQKRIGSQAGREREIKIDRFEINDATEAQDTSKTISATTDTWRLRGKPCTEKRVEGVKIRQFFLAILNLLNSRGANMHDGGKFQFFAEKGAESIFFLLRNFTHLSFRVKSMTFGGQQSLSEKREKNNKWTFLLRKQVFVLLGKSTKLLLIPISFPIRQKKFKNIVSLSHCVLTKTNRRGRQDLA